MLFYFILLDFNKLVVHFYYLIIPILLKVMRDQNGISKGSGFVAFSTTEEADRAVSIFLLPILFRYNSLVVIYSNYVHK